MSVPFVKRDRSRAIEDEDAEVEEVGRGMKFTLLTKKGSKQQVRPFARRDEALTDFPCCSQTFSMEIPRESSIAVHTLEKRAKDKAEQQQLKRLVLDYEQREEASEKQGSSVPHRSLALL